jgi:hypothetical protein
MQINVYTHIYFARLNRVGPLGSGHNHNGEEGWHGRATIRRGADDEEALENAYGQATRGRSNDFTIITSLRYYKLRV